MNRENQTTTVIRGDLLSCYTTSIAEYMEYSGIQHQLVLGTQLFLAVSRKEEDAAPLSFVHYHTPLLGTHPTYSLHLTQKSSSDPEEAAQCIKIQCKLFGAVIVAGDAWNLPWLITYRHKHAPHWFVITDIDEQEQRVHIADRFEFTDEHGTQQPFEGYVEQRQLSDLAAVNPISNHIYQARKRWAFGADNWEASNGLQRYEWFEAVEQPECSLVTPQNIGEFLFNTWAFHTKRRQRGDLPAAQWACGIDALRFLANLFDEQVDNPVLYDHSDDLWVAARNRRMFVSVLKMVGLKYDLGEFNTLAGSCEEELIPLWEAIPRVMRYNMGCLQRGRKPRSLLGESLSRLAVLEEDVMQCLCTIVESNKL